jgi:hypothetical protein
MVTRVMVEPPAVAAKTLVPVEFDASVTVVLPVVTGFQ